MNIVDKAVATQLKNIETKTGKTLEQLGAMIRASGLAKHGEIRDMLKRDLSLGHGDANALALTVNKVVAAGGDDPAAEIYSGSKAGLRPAHDKIMAAIAKFGEFEIAPKKSYLSLRRKKQFAMVGPATSSKLEVGLNMKDVAATERLVAVPPGGMCQYKVRLAKASEVDKDLIGWIKTAYDASA